MLQRYRNRLFWFLAALACHGSFMGCPKNARMTQSQFAKLGIPADTPIKVIETRHVDGLPQLVQLETVFWKAADTTSLRALIFDSDLVKDKSVLEIGSGTGLVSLCCLKSGAAEVPATDINPSAVANTWFNAENLALRNHLEVRLVAQSNPTAFAVIKSDEKFDLIISNPPWEDGRTEGFETNAFIDPGVELMKSLVTQSDKHLKPGGRVLLAYGCVTAIRQLKKLAAEHNWQLTVHDDRNLDELPELFLPGMLLELHH